MPLLDLDDYPVPLSAFIFASGVTAAFDPLGTVNTWVSTPNERALTNTNITGVPIATFAPGTMTSVLLCDPHFMISKAEVTLQDGQLHANPVEQPLLGNFPESAANSLFSQAFLNAKFPRGSVVFPFTTGPENRQTLLTLPEINDNMNRLIQSAAKAYTSGFTGFNGPQPETFPSYTYFNQTATVQSSEISLVSSQPFLVALWVLDGAIALILAILLCITNARKMRLFNLQTMETVYRGMLCTGALHNG